MNDLDQMQYVDLFQEKYLLFFAKSLRKNTSTQKINYRPKKMQVEGIMTYFAIINNRALYKSILCNIKY